MKESIEQEILLKIDNLHVHFNTEAGVIHAVNGIDFSLKKGETLAIVGESGSGKSVTALAILRILDENGFIQQGSILYQGKDLTKTSYKNLNAIRGKEIAMIFQEPMTALNPVFTIGYQISESVRLHSKMQNKEIKEKSIKLLQDVGIPEPNKRFHQYPHELSGGMRQRAMIAMALSCNPSILIADEPTTSLDVTIQAQILELMGNIQKMYGMAILFITHDLGVVAEIADRAIVMYGGEIMEQGTTIDIFKNPHHPYTWGLLNSIPRIEKDKKELWSIPGTVPNPLDFPKGCKFSNRCFLLGEKCIKEHPLLEKIKTHNNQFSRCWYIDKLVNEISKSNKDK